MKSIQITNAGTVECPKIQSVFRTLKNIYEAFSAIDYSHTKKLQHRCLICISVPLNTPLKLQTKAIWTTLLRYFWSFIINFEQIEHYLRNLYCELGNVLPGCMFSISKEDSSLLTVLGGCLI